MSLISTLLPFLLQALLLTRLPTSSASSASSTSEPQNVDASAVVGGDPAAAPEICARYPPTFPVSLEQTNSTCLDSLVLTRSSASVATKNNPLGLIPWTHAPHCIYADASPHCVFTNAHHSISIITTPDEASGSLNLLSHSVGAPFFAPHKLLYSAAHAADADADAADASNNGGGSSSSSRKKPPYKVVDIPGKGKGAVATQKIKKGMAVLVDTAAVLAEAEYPPDVTREEVEYLVNEAVRRLADGGEGVMGLSRKGDLKTGVRREEKVDGGTDREIGEVEDRLLTNSFVVGLGGRQYMGLFVNVARFNHDCRPNAFIHFSETTLAMTIWSARDIEEGEEITITYSPAGMLSKERQSTLEKVWGFKCKCALCTSPPSVLEQSDSNRVEINKLKDSVMELAQGGKFKQALAAAERMFELIDVEGMTEQMGDMYEVPATLYYRVGNFEKSLEYMLKVKNEIDGYGLPGKFGQEKLKVLDGLIKVIEKQLELQKNPGVGPDQGVKREKKKKDDKKKTVKKAKQPGKTKHKRGGKKAKVVRAGKKVKLGGKNGGKKPKGK